MMNRCSLWLLAACALVACQASAPAPAPTALHVAALRELPATEPVARGTDAIGLRRYELEVGEQTRQLPAALDVRLQGETAVVWLPDHRLARFGVEGAPRLLARDVGSPALVDARRIVYAIEVAGAAELRVLEQGAETTLARGLSSAGAFRLGPEGERVFFVGAINGGVAGLWVARFSEATAQCVTNCDLRVGQAWEGYVPPPPSAESLEFGDGIVMYVAMDGTAVTRSLP